VDSPLAVDLTAVFRRHPECYDLETSTFAREGDPFGFQLLTMVESVEDSKKLNSLSGPAIIISASGMCEAGRIVHHLRNSIEDPRNSIVIVGFQAQHTLGRRIVERRDEIKIFGQMYKLLCRVEVLNGFSAHADRDDFKRLLTPLAKRLKGAFLVHGETDALSAMQDLLSAAGCRNIQIPVPGERHRL
jgi:metallo-beta-lactamase family protein